MLKFQQLLRKEEQNLLIRIEVLNMLTPSVMICTRESRRIPTSNDYLELEAYITRAHTHNPVWGFQNAPNVGTFVIAKMENKSYFKRGVILYKERAGDEHNYFVFLYDWGIIECFAIDDLAQLPPEQEHKLIPRSFLIVNPGLVEYNPKKALKQRQIKSKIFSENKIDLPASQQGKSWDHETSANVSKKAKLFAMNWLDSRECVMRIFKNYQNVMFVAKVKGPEPCENGNVRDVSFSSVMRHNQFARSDGHLRKQDEDYEVDNWMSIVDRFARIVFDEVIKSKNRVMKGCSNGLTSDNAADKAKVVHEPSSQQINVPNGKS